MVRGPARASTVLIIELSMMGSIYDDDTHGLGVERWADGNIYEGEYRAGNRSGHGVFRYASGDVYEGGWLNNLMSGYGIFRYSVIPMVISMREDI
jgi:hypothetical protein